MYDLLKLHFEKLLKMIIVKQNKKGIRMYPYEKRSYELRVWRKKIPKPGGKVARTFYMRVGYVFESHFSAETTSMIFDILNKEWWNFKKMLFIFYCR